MSKTSLGIIISVVNSYQLHYILLECQGMTETKVNYSYTA